MPRGLRIVNRRRGVAPLRVVGLFAHRVARKRRAQTFGEQLGGGLAGVCRRLGLVFDQRLDLGHQLLHATDDRGRVEVRARKRGRELLCECGQRGLPAFLQRLEGVAGRGRILLNRRAQCLHLLGEVRRRLFERGQAFEPNHQSFVLGDLARERDLVTVVVPLEEQVGGGAEPVPHHFGLVAAHRTNRLPLRLHPLQFV